MVPDQLNLSKLEQSIFVADEKVLIVELLNGTPARRVTLAIGSDLRRRAALGEWNGIEERSEMAAHVVSAPGQLPLYDADSRSGLRNVT